MDEDQFFENFQQFIDNNADACEVVIMAHELARHIEEKFEYSRKTVCEGMLVAAVTMAISRLDDLYFQSPETTREFYDWAIKFIEARKEDFFTEEQQRKYESLYGKGNANSLPVAYYKDVIN